MSAAALGSSEGLFAERAEPGLAGSALAAIVIHLLLAAMLFFGVRWTSSPPEIVEVELWSPPAPVVEPAPPPPPLRVEPQLEPQIRRPDIALKSPKANPPPPKPVPKVEPREEKPDPKLLKAREEEMKKRMLAELASEQSKFATERREVEQKEQVAKEVAAARAKALADYVSRIKAKIRGNMVLPPDLRGNPEAVFELIQLPTGEVRTGSVKLRRSSGQPALDEAIERAILKSSPLPKPDKPELFDRSLEIRYRPLDP